MNHPTYYLATLEANYELSACATTPAEAMKLRKKAWKDFWANAKGYGGDSSTWKEHVAGDGARITLRALVPGTIYCDGDGPFDGATPYDERPAWGWSPVAADGLPDARYGSQEIR